MKCVSIRQPWADLIVDRKRLIEVRSWTHPYRGPLLIHAAAKIETAECNRLGITPSSTGTIIGVADLIDIRNIVNDWSALVEMHLEAGAPCYGGKTLGWFLENASRLRRPIPFSGKLGIFEVPDEIIPRYRILKGRKTVESIVAGRYAGIRSTMIFGRLDCKSGIRARKENRVFFHTWEDAVAAGYRPCKHCKPTPHD